LPFAVALPRDRCRPPVAERVQDALPVEIEVHVRALAELVANADEVGLMVAVGREAVAVSSSPT